MFIGRRRSRPHGQQVDLRLLSAVPPDVYIAKVRRCHCATELSPRGCGRGVGRHLQVSRRRRCTARWVDDDAVIELNWPSRSRHPSHGSQRNLLDAEISSRAGVSSPVFHGPLPLTWAGERSSGQAVSGSTHCRGSPTLAGPDVRYRCEPSTRQRSAESSGPLAGASRRRCSVAPRRGCD